MSDIREMQAVGTISKEVADQMSSGYNAQGWALAQTIMAQTISTSQGFRRCVDTAFSYDTQARKACIDELNRWRKELMTNAKANENLRRGGHSERDLGALARSAAVHVSEFTTICTAMNNGMTRDTLAQSGGITREDVDNMSFHVIVSLARKFNSTSATRQGRPSDPFTVKLAKWLKNQQVEGQDADVKAAVERMLAAVLPVEGEKKDETLHRRATDK